MEKELCSTHFFLLLCLLSVERIILWFIRVIPCSINNLSLYLLNSILLYEFVTLCLFTCWWTFRLFWVLALINNTMNFTYQCLYRRVLSFLLDESVRVKWQSRMVGGPTYHMTLANFLKNWHTSFQSIVLFYFLTSLVGGFQLFHVFVSIWYGQSF